MVIYNIEADSGEVVSDAIKNQNQISSKVDNLCMSDQIASDLREID